MTNGEVIKIVKNYCRDTNELGKPCNDARDAVLYGEQHLNDECKKIVCCGFCSIDVVKKAIEAGANLIMCHEGMFYCHGDDTSWQVGYNATETKKKLLEDNHILVWRNWEHLACGIPVGDDYFDGAQYGIIKDLGWEKYLRRVDENDHLQNYLIMLDFGKEKTTRQIANEIVDKLGLNGLRIVGSVDEPVSKAAISRHQIFGTIDSYVLTHMEEEEIEMVIAPELVEYTLCSYVRESTMIGRNRSLINLGNFNEGEAAMKYAPVWMKEAVQGIETVYIGSGDSVGCYLGGPK